MLACLFNIRCWKLNIDFTIGVNFQCFGVWIILYVTSLPVFGLFLQVILILYHYAHFHWQQLFYFLWINLNINLFFYCAWGNYSHWFLMLFFIYLFIFDLIGWGYIYQENITMINAFLFWIMYDSGCGST